MSETHRSEYEYFDLKVEVTDAGDIWVSFIPVNGDAIKMDWDSFIDCVDFAAKHGKGMDNPTLVEFVETKEADLA